MSVMGGEQLVEHVAEPGFEQIDLGVRNRHVFRPIVRNGPPVAMILCRTARPTLWRTQIVVEIVGCGMPRRSIERPNFTPRYAAAFSVTRAPAGATSLTGRIIAWRPKRRAAEAGRGRKPASRSRLSASLDGPTAVRQGLS